MFLMYAGHHKLREHFSCASSFLSWSANNGLPHGGRLPSTTRCAKPSKFIPCTSIHRSAINTRAGEHSVDFNYHHDHPHPRRDTYHWVITNQPFGTKSSKHQSATTVTARYIINSSESPAGSRIHSSYSSINQTKLKYLKPKTALVTKSNITSRSHTTRNGTRRKNHEKIKHVSHPAPAESQHIVSTASSRMHRGKRGLGE